MMNFTFSRLSLQNIGKSPVFNKFSNINIEKSMYSQFSSPLLMNPKSSILNNVKFNKGLSSAIRINQKDISVPSNKPYYNEIKEDQTIFVKRCVFLNIKSSTDYAIIDCRCDKSSYGTLSVYQSTFAESFSSKCGAIYSNLRDFECYSSCFYHCASTYATCLYTNSRLNGLNYLNLSTVVHCTYMKGTEEPVSTIVLHDGYQSLVDFNLSGNAFAEGQTNALHIESTTTSALTVSYNIYSFNFDVGLIFIAGQCPNRKFSHVSFYQNEGVPLIRYDYDLTLDNCRFLENKDTFIVQRVQVGDTPHDAVIKFVDCQSDQKPSTNDAALLSVLSDIKITKVKLEKMGFLNTKYCAGNTLNSTVATVIMVIILILLIAAIITIFIYTDYKKDPTKYRNVYQKIKSKIERRKLPDYEAGLADIQVEQSLEQN